MTDNMMYQAHKCVLCTLEGRVTWITSRRERQEHERAAHKLPKGARKVGNLPPAPTHFKRYKSLRTTNT